MEYAKALNQIQSRMVEMGSAFDYLLYADCFEICRMMKDSGDNAAHEWNQKLRELTSRAVQALGSNGRQFYDLYRRSLLFDAPVDFDAYLQYVEFDREPTKRFYLPRRKQLKGMIDLMQQLADDDLDLLTISLPPGTGKSTAGIFFLSWLMGKHPDRPSLASAHSGSLTRSFYDGVLQILSDPEYLWGDVFPGSGLAATNAKEETLDLNKSHRFSTLTCRSIDGSLTGATRCEVLLYADDMCSGIEEALSKDRMDKLWHKYTTDLKSRKKEGCKELHIATRWTIHDLIGRLEAMNENNLRAKFLTIPALDEQGESNFEYAYGVGFGAQYFVDMRETLDDASWRALFMNEPIEREGLLYHVEDLRRYYDLPAGDPDAIVGFCDTAEGGGDDTVLLVGYLYGKDCYIDDCVCSNALPEVTDALCADVLLRNRVQQCPFESNGAGGRTADKVHDIVQTKNGNTHITKKRTTSNKETRIIVNSDYVKRHFLFRDASRYPKNSSYAHLVNKLCSYTMLGKNKHDDVPDAASNLALFIQSLSAAKVEIMDRLF